MTKTFTSIYRTGRPELTVAFWPPKGTFVGAPPLEAAVDEVRDLCARSAAAKQEATEAVVAVERAEIEDRQAAADAVRGNTRRPQPKRPAAEKRQREAEHEAGVLEIAAADAADAALEALDEHGPALAAKLGARRTKLCEALTTTLDKATRIEAELGEILGLTAYLASDEVAAWQGMQKYGISRVAVPRTSDAPSFRVLLEALKEAVGEKLPEREQPAPNVQPLLPHPLRGAA
jgi:hypothetical protein